MGAFAVSHLFAAPAWGAIARTGAWLNLFNLIPVWQLDGSRGFAALNGQRRLLVAGAFAAAWILTSEGLLVLLALVAFGRACERSAPAEGDRATSRQFLLLIALLSALVALPVAPAGR